MILTLCLDLKIENSFSYVVDLFIHVLIINFLMKCCYCAHPSYYVICFPVSCRQACIVMLFVIYYSRQLMMFILYICQSEAKIHSFLYKFVCFICLFSYFVNNQIKGWLPEILKWYTELVKKINCVILVWSVNKAAGQSVLNVAFLLTFWG